MIDEDDTWRRDLRGLLREEEEDEHWHAAVIWAERIADGFVYQGHGRLAAQFYALADTFIPTGDEP